MVEDETLYQALLSLKERQRAFRAVRDYYGEKPTDNAINGGAGRMHPQSDEGGLEVHGADADAAGNPDEMEEPAMKLQCDLFDFAYVSGWYWQLDCLAGMAFKEPWRFWEPVYPTKNPDTPILERYINSIFKKQAIDFNGEDDPAEAAWHFHVENEFCRFHTGLYIGRYKAVYACIDRNKKPASMRGWYFRGFADEMSPWLKYVSLLPERPSYHMAQYGVNYNPEWPIRVNIDHILGDAENVSRLPAAIRGAHNLPLLLETAVELARRRVVVEPGIVVP